MSTILKREYFNDLASRWDNLHDLSAITNKIKEFVNRTAHSNPKCILDVGCGTGVLLPFLLEKYSTTASIVEVDFAENMLLKSVAKQTNNNVWHVCADARFIPFAEESFDLLLCFAVLPHLGNFSLLLKNMFALLRPNGVLGIGHLMSSTDLNRFHSSLAGPISNDYLPAAKELALILDKLGAGNIVAEENLYWYLIRAEKVIS